MSNTNLIMGYYTELKFKAALKKDTPSEIINFLTKTIIERDLGLDENQVFFNHFDIPPPALGHEFFKCGRWYMLFMSTNWGDIKGGHFYKEKDYWILDLHTEFKNYDGEIEKFVNWITPYIAGRKKKQYLGYSRGEQQDRQENIYIER